MPGNQIHTLPCLPITDNIILADDCDEFAGMSRTADLSTQRENMGILDARLPGQSERSLARKPIGSNAGSAVRESTAKSVHES